MQARQDLLDSRVEVRLAHLVVVVLPQGLLRSADDDSVAHDSVGRELGLVLGRGPGPEELSLGRAFLENADAAFSETLADYCLVLFNLDEFLYVD